MRTLASLLLATAAAFAPPLGAQRPPLTVLVDGSGSMRGFGTELVRMVNGLRTGSDDLAYAFTYTAQEDAAPRGGIAPFDPAAFGAGNVTLLWRGLSDYLSDPSRPGELIALVTDNVQDAGGHPREEQDVGEFYDELARDGRVGTVYVLPLRLPFNGTLYGAHGAPAIGPYQGERGLVVYLVARVGVAEPHVRQAAGALARQLASEPIRMKPYDTAPVRAWVDTAASRVAAANDTCGGAPLVPAPGEEGVLERAGAQPGGRPFGGTFVVRLRSELEGVSLSRPEVHPGVVEDFRFTDFVAEGRPVVQATPPRLQATFAPGDSAAVAVRVCFPRGVVFDTSPRSLARYVFLRRPHGRYEGNVRIGLRTAQSELQLAERVRERFSTVDPAFFTSTHPDLHQRVYGLERAFRRLAPPSVTVDVPLDYRVRFAVRYPQWPAVVLVLAVLAVAALLALATWLLLRGGLYRLQEMGPGAFYAEAARPARRAARDGGGGDLLLEPSRASRGGADAGRLVRLRPWSGCPLHLNGVEAAVIRARPFVGSVVVARPGFSVDGARARPLNPGGTSFSLAPIAPGPGRGEGADLREAPHDVVLDPSRL
jgi:hypothetical protein